MVSANAHHLLENETNAGTIHHHYHYYKHVSIVVYDTDGTIVLYAAGSGPLSSCSANDGKWISSIQASTTYTEVTIIDPLEFATLAGLIGGWLGIMATVGMILFIIYT
jgi:hypothetical protein